MKTNQFKFNLINAAWAIDLISFVDLIWLMQIEASFHLIYALVLWILGYPAIAEWINFQTSSPLRQTCFQLILRILAFWFRQCFIPHWLLNDMKSNWRHSVYFNQAANQLLELKTCRNGIEIYWANQMLDGATTN